MKEYFRTYLSFSKSQQRGVIFLSLLTILLIFGNLFFKRFFKPKAITYEDYSSQVNEFLTEKETDSEENKEYRFVDFDPNEVSIQELLMMGLSEKQANNVINYREKVGPYNRISDFQNLYTVDDELFQKIENHIQINLTPKKTVVTKSLNQRVVNKKIVNETLSIVFEINSADTTELKKIRGIGSYYANRIVKFRDALGGFYTLDQLHEVYGLKDNPETIESIKGKLIIDPALCSKIRINEVSADSLALHPYFSRKLANVLTNYRDQHGPFEKKEDVKKCRLVTEDIYPNIAAYITLE